VTASLEPTAAELASADDHQLALLLAREAGRELLAIRADGIDRGLDARLLKAAGDAGAQQVLSRLLSAARPEDAVLSEEAKDDLSRLSASRVWIIDPLDGTREYSEHPRTDWAVHVALWADGELVAGAVTLPAAGAEYSTADPQPSPTGLPATIRLAVSRSRPPDFVQRLAESLGAQLVPMGSAGVKATSVLRDEADAYVHAGGQFEWDSAAPVAVAVAAGLHASRIDGSSLRYNRPDPSLPDLVICRPEVATTLLAAIARLVHEGNASS
jgi:3'(2'), 5'-bisphosphate nucleotidase